MAIIYPTLENIQRLKVEPTLGEIHLVKYLEKNLDDSYEVFFNPYLDGDRPDIIILKNHFAVFIIEVKDWNLENYIVTEDNKWKFFDGKKISGKLSPQAQAFRYKKNLYDLHLPVIGLKRLINENFFNLVHPYVYFHKAEKKSIDLLYCQAEETHRKKQMELNALFTKKKKNFEQYNRDINYLDKKKRNLQRDKAMSFGNDQINNLIKKIKRESKHILFDESVYHDFKRRLSPPENILKQGIKIAFDKKQLNLTKSKNVKIKIKGVAGCGKTSILSQRAINSTQRHGDITLILTFNITLKNYIKDKISDIQGSRDFLSFEISNYHQFYRSQINNTEIDIDDSLKELGIIKNSSTDIYSINIFKDHNVKKYKTILVDEVQDYQPEWIKIIRDNFLHENGEMVLFGNESQDIYRRDITKSPIITKGFGNWFKLKKSYRTNSNSPLNQIFKEFQLNFLIKKHPDIEITNVSTAQLGINFGLLKYKKTSANDWKRTAFNIIKTYIKMYSLHPNDVVILSSKISYIRQLNERLIREEKTHCMFETYEEISSLTGRSINDLKKLNEIEFNAILEDKDYKSDINRIRKSKKNHFYANSGLIKLSTTHSYKGLESKTVFYILDEKDDAEIIYTSITRSSENLFIIDIGRKNICSDFLEKSIRNTQQEKIQEHKNQSEVETFPL